MRKRQKQLIVSRFTKIRNYTTLMLKVLDEIDYWSSPNMSSEDYDAFRQIDYNMGQIEQLLDGIDEHIANFRKQLGDTDA